MSEIAELIARWDANEGKPYKGSLIDWDSYGGEGEPRLSCMCAQGQVLHVVGGRGPDWFRNIRQSEADRETAKLLNISRAHSILLRNINDKADGAPSIVLTDPGKVLGDQWSKLLDFWWAFDQFGADDWRKVAAAWDAAVAAAWDAARAAAGAAARDAARDAAGDAAWEIQGFEVLTSRGRGVFFLPMFGWASPADIPPRPADYGLGIVPVS